MKHVNYIFTNKSNLRSLLLSYFSLASNMKLFHKKKKPVNEHDKPDKEEIEKQFAKLLVGYDTIT